MGCGGTFNRWGMGAANRCLCAWPWETPLTASPCPPPSWVDRMMGTTAVAMAFDILDVLLFVFDMWTDVLVIKVGAGPGGGKEVWMC